MITCKVTGKGEDMYCAQRLLHQAVGENLVQSNIPEAARYNSGKCSASFILDADFIDLQKINSIRCPKIEVYFPGSVYVKQRNKNSGFWRAKRNA